MPCNFLKFFAYASGFWFLTASILSYGPRKYYDRGREQRFIDFRDNDFLTRMGRIRVLDCRILRISILDKVVGLIVQG